MNKETLKKYKWDIIIIASLLICSLVVFLCLYFVSNKNNLIAEVKKENEIILKIDLSKENESRTIELKTYDEKIDMDIEVKQNAIRVSRSGCPTQYCVNQGFISNSNQSIICAHYKVVISLGASSGDINI